MIPVCLYGVRKNMQKNFHRLTATIVLLLCLAPGANADISYLEVTGEGGVPLVVATAGDPANPAILFLHGIASSHYVFLPLLESSLAEDYFLIAPDLRGHGGSGKPWDAAAYNSSPPWAGDVNAVLKATGGRRPLVVAWSFGTLVAMDFIRENGAGSVSGLVLTGAIGALKPFRFSSEDDPLTAEFQEARQLQLSADPRDQVEASRRMVGWLTAEPLPAVEHGMMQSIALMFPSYVRRAIYGRMQDNQDLLPQLQSLPTLLALGEEDNALLLEDGAALAAEYSNMELSPYTGAGHTVFLEAPEKFAEELRGFAESLAINIADGSEISASKK